MFKKLSAITLIGLSVIMTGCSDWPITRVTDVEVGIRETPFGEIKDEVIEQGVAQTFWGDVHKFSKRNIVLDVSANPVTSEKVPLAKFYLKVNYGIVSENAAIAYKSEKANHKTTEDGETFLLGKYVEEVVSKSAINDIISKYKSLEVNENRTQIEAEIKDSINAKLKESGKDRFVRVNEVNITDAVPHQNILSSSLAIVTSQNALRTKENELKTAQVETEIKKVLAQNASAQYIELQRAEAELNTSKALLIAANKGTLNTTIIVPKDFTSIGNFNN